MSRKIQFPSKPCGLPITQAVEEEPLLIQYQSKNSTKIDLGNPEALLLYNRVILRHFLGLDFTIPEGYLIPTICSRWDFLDWIFDDFRQLDRSLTCLELGTGASAILALMLAKLGCTVDTTEVDSTAYESAMKNIINNHLEELIHITKSEGQIITNLINSLDKYDVIICNPPQYDLQYFENTKLKEKGFHGQYYELVGGPSGSEFIFQLLQELNSFNKPPPLCFQLTRPNLHQEIDKFLYDNNLHVTVKVNHIGNRQRYYYKILFTQ